MKASIQVVAAEEAEEELKRHEVVNYSLRVPTVNKGLKQ